MSKRGFLGDPLLPYVCLVAATTGAWLFLFRIDSCLLGGDVLDAYICLSGTGHALAVDFAPDLAIVLGVMLALFSLLNKFRPKTRVGVGFIACVVFVLPLTLTVRFFRAYYFPPTLVGTITSLPMNNYVVINDRSGRPAGVHVHDEDMETLLVGDKIAVTMIGPLGPKDTIQSEWSQRSGFISLAGLPSQLRDLPGSTPYILALRVHVLSKSTARQPTQWMPVVSLMTQVKTSSKTILRLRPFQWGQTGGGCAGLPR